MSKDGPWVYSGSPMIRIKRGERLTVNDPHHRTKGAKHGKGFHTDPKPAGFAPANGISEANRSNSRRKSRERRHARRAAMRNLAVNGK